MLRRSFSRSSRCLRDSYGYQLTSSHSYIQHADSKDGVNPLDGWTPSVPAGEAFELGTDAYRTTERLGMKELGSVGFVLVAGGLGERLGYKGAKVRLFSYACNAKKYLSIAEFRQSLIPAMSSVLARHQSLFRSDFRRNRQRGPSTYNTTANISKL